MSFTPNTTQTPNWLYDSEMRKMNETELKVVLLTTRKTLGWFNPTTNERKTQDYIAQKQFMEFTGKSHTAIAHAIQSCVECKWIIAKDKEGNLCDTPEKRRRRKVWYQLGNIFIDKSSKQHSSLDKKSSKQHSCTHLSNNVDNTKETNTKENIVGKADEKSFLQKKIPPKEIKPFNSSSYVMELTKDKQRHIRIVGWFFQSTAMTFPSLRAVQKEIGRHLKDAAILADYEDDRVANAVDYVKKKFPDEWKLSTVLKYINKI